ncbi:hypothetical protein ACN28I_04425 [Archangium gephyra]
MRAQRLREWLAERLQQADFGAARERHERQVVGRLPEGILQLVTAPEAS